MKHEINLLPPRLRRINLTLVYLKHAELGLVAVVILALLVWGGILAGRQFIERMMARDQLALEQLRTQIASFSDLEKKIAITNQRVKTAQQLTKQATDWPKILQEITKVTPETVKLTRLATAKENNTPWQLEATASSQREMLIFQAKVEESALFANATISATSLANASNPTGPINFSMKFSITSQP